MKRLLLFLALLPALANAIPTCPVYPYHDFAWANNYQQPARPQDSLIDNCQSLDLADKSVCDRLGNLSDDQKKILITDNLVRNNGLPDFNASKNWNYALQFTKYAPDGTNLTSSGSIRDAWIRIISLTPSVLENGQLFINGTGELYSRANLSFVVNRQSFPGDCQTNYEICGYNYAVQNTNNGQSIGTGTKSNFSVLRVHNASNAFVSTLTANSEYLVHHYHTVRHCYTTFSGTYCYYSCDYSSSDDIHDSATTSDSKTAYYYDFNHSEASMVDSFNSGLLDGWISLALSDDFSNFRLGFGNSWLRTQNRQYGLAYGLAPYNALTPGAYYDQKSQAYNIVFLSRETATNNSIYREKTHFQVGANGTDCILEINSHFGHWENGSFCHELNQTPVIALNFTNETNASFWLSVRFYDNQTGLPLVQKQITLYYAGTNQAVTTDSEGQATASFSYTKTSSMVRAVFLTDFETKSASAILVLPTRTPDFFASLFYIALALLTAYLLYQLARRLLK